MQERALLPAVQEGIPERMDTELQFTEVFETYYKRIFNYIAYRVSCRYTAEDLASQVFEKTLTKLCGYSRDKAPLEVWLFAIARNVVNDHYRSQARHRWFPLEAIRELVSGRKEPEALILGIERSDRLNLALDKLSAKQRNMIALKFGADLKNTEIAQVMGISESNVGVILYRSLQKLKSEIGSVESL
ncbi:sigma-70 family RNA polymerase sigma factor [Paenibacillus sp. MMS20-IR301]|uniref:sigma-70 family RNA polymerase sigma factor n=1 Tax=Paenibacillus sp. MMS20-IR301 TaxID=2895946 RepID=UPI0028F15FA4|nr:sigma-70 family RNA polymerase sigma factor [Paenibacillus sp. MMS20-IR301]WNS41116.1 sigma-70 family RNA polymerase sigma factor [Paenibacillus sp. MMS20-IR301]